MQQQQQQQQTAAINIKFLSIVVSYLIFYLFVLYTMNTFPIYLKYRCENVGVWHSHRLTEQEIIWHNRISDVEVSHKIPESQTKQTLGKHFSWYIGVKKAMVELQRYNDGKPAVFVVCVKDHPFSHCCADDVNTFCTFLPVVIPLPRSPLHPIHCQNQKNDIGAHGGSALVVKEAATVKVVCEPLAKTISSTQNQVPVQSQKATIDSCDNNDIYMDENDTRDDLAHLPQHFHVPSRPATMVKKPKA